MHTIKEEIFIDFKIRETENVPKSIDDYIDYFNKERPASSLNYLTPTQFKERYYTNL